MRIEPTPEDMAIAERNIFRITRQFVGQRLTPELKHRITVAMMNALNDYIEVPPHDGEIDF